MIASGSVAASVARASFISRALSACSFSPATLTCHRLPTPTLFLPPIQLRSFHTQRRLRFPSLLLPSSSSFPPHRSFSSSSSFHLDPSRLATRARARLLYNLSLLLGDSPSRNELDANQRLQPPPYTVLTVETIEGGITRIKLVIQTEGRDEKGEEEPAWTVVPERGREGEEEEEEKKKKERAPTDPPLPPPAPGQFRIRPPPPKNGLIDYTPAILLLPPRPPPSSSSSFSSPYPFPAVLCLHQTTDPATIGMYEPAGLAGDAQLAYAMELTRRGYVTLSPQYPGFGTYHMGDQIYYSFELGYNSLLMKAIWNNLLCIDLLSSYPLIDPTRIAVLGHSLGASLSLFSSAFDPRIQAVVSSCGFTSWRAYAEKSEWYNGNRKEEGRKRGGTGDLSGWARPEKYMPAIHMEYTSDWRKMPIEWEEIVGLVGPRPLFVSAPREDHVFDVEGVKETMVKVRRKYEEAEEEERRRNKNTAEGRSATSSSSRSVGEVSAADVEYASDRNLVCVHPNCGHEFPARVREKAYQFLDRFLHHQKPN